MQTGKVEIIDGREKQMTKVIIQCNAFTRPNDFEQMKENMIQEFNEKGILVLPAYCSLKAVLDNDGEIEIVEGE